MSGSCWECSTCCAARPSSLRWRASRACRPGHWLQVPSSPASWSCRCCSSSPASGRSGCSIPGWPSGNGQAGPTLDKGPTMELILREDVQHLGKAGDVVKVKDGYARNYLLPKGLAYLATEANKKKIAFEAERIARQRAAEKGVAETEATRL